MNGVLGVRFDGFSIGSLGILARAKACWVRLSETSDEAVLRR